MGGRRYNVFCYNCETSANYCAHGKGGSRQVRRFTGHAAFCTATIPAAATSVSVGIVTYKTHVLTVPDPGWYGLKGFLGYTITKTVVFSVTHPIGIAAASG